jgi:ribonuclease P protein component
VGLFAKKPVRMKRAYRVKKHQQFVDITSKGRFSKDSHYVVYYVPNQAGLSHLGIQVSKKNGGAVKRNLIKRQIRAIIAEGYDLTKPYDIVIIARTSYDPEKYQAEKEELLKLLASIGANELGTKN